MFTRLVHIYFLVFSFVWLVFTHTRSFGSSLLVRLVRVRVLEIKIHIYFFSFSRLVHVRLFSCSLICLIRWHSLTFKSVHEEVPKRCHDVAVRLQCERVVVTLLL